MHIQHLLPKGQGRRGPTDMGSCHQTPITLSLAVAEQNSTCASLCITMHVMLTSLSSNFFKIVSPYTQHQAPAWYWYNIQRPTPNREADQQPTIICSPLNLRNDAKRRTAVQTCWLKPALASAVAIQSSRPCCPCPRPPAPFNNDH